VEEEDKAGGRGRGRGRGSSLCCNRSLPIHVEIIARCGSHRDSKLSGNACRAVLGGVFFSLSHPPPMGRRGGGGMGGWDASEREREREREADGSRLLLRGFGRKETSRKIV